MSETTSQVVRQVRADVEEMLHEAKNRIRPKVYGADRTRCDSLIMNLQSLKEVLGHATSFSERMAQVFYRSQRILEALR